MRHLLALDASTVMARFAARQDSMVGLFSRLRDRAPMLSVLDTRFDTITFGELSLLEPVEQRAVSRFHEVLGELRWYLAYTEDMPLQVQTRLTGSARRLEAAFRELVATIGPPEADGARVLEVEVVSKAGRRPRPSRPG
ncbi:MAG: hypothetical protein INH41_12185 [Myxococcaceae bacterium]|nr:hypothetical protein [Myxococcaceae bacterium]MCA3013144.1 hypothetical protein [Myxococcaceae bacterium]